MKNRRDYEPLARTIKALAHPTRLFIIRQLEKRKHCVCELRDLCGLDISTISKHLALLKEAGVVTDEKQGQMVFYSLCATCILPFLDCMKSVALRKAKENLGRYEKKMKKRVKKGRRSVNSFTIGRRARNGPGFDL